MAKTQDIFAWPRRGIAEARMLRLNRALREQCDADRIVSLKAKARTARAVYGDVPTEYRVQLKPTGHGTVHMRYRNHARLDSYTHSLLESAVHMERFLDVQSSTKITERMGAVHTFLETVRKLLCRVDRRSRRVLHRLLDKRESELAYLNRYAQAKWPG